MKYLSFFIMLFSLNNGYAQTTDSINVSEVNVVWKARPNMYPLKRGFYKTYAEFLENAPSIQRTFTLVEKTKSEERKARGICAVNFDIKEGEDKVGRIWGFCDGNAVYAKVNRLEGKYWKLEYIGPHSYFIHVSQVRSLGTLIAASALGTREFSFIANDGKMVQIFTSGLKRLLKQCPGLDEEFESDPNKKDEEVKKKYLRRLNEYLAK
jgi:hypothetical protein